MSVNQEDRPVPTTEAELAEMKIAPMGDFSEHWVDADGNPAGGVSCGMGYTISWQMGPLGRGEDRRIPNGAFVESIIFAAIDRLQFYQKSKFKCDENQAAIDNLKGALEMLEYRTEQREAREVEGTHAI